MTSPDDLELRRRSIFDRLRAEVEGETEGDPVDRVDDPDASEERASRPQADGDDSPRVEVGTAVEGGAAAHGSVDDVAGADDGQPDWGPANADRSALEAARTEPAWAEREANDVTEGAGDEREAPAEPPNGSDVGTARWHPPVATQPAGGETPYDDLLPEPSDVGRSSPSGLEPDTDAVPSGSDVDHGAVEGVGAGTAWSAADPAARDVAPSEARGGDTASERAELDGRPAAAAADDLAAETAPLHPEPGTTSAPPAAPTRPPLPRILAVANQKGGVGKTTTAVNLSAGLAELGYRVLVIDLDPQGNATTGLGINARNLDVSIYDVLLHDTPMEDTIEPSSLRNLFVVPATIDLAGAEIELVPAFSRELRLRKALETVLDDFDYVFIDCPPSLGLLTVNGLAAATEVLVPIQCEYYALEGLGQLLRNVNLVQANLNPTLELSTIVLTMFDARTKLAEQVVGDVRAHFGAKVCRNVVPRTVRLSEAPSFGQPITMFDPTSRGAIAYRELAKEVSGGPAERLG